jgi:hypothetical protein
LEIALNTTEAEYIAMSQATRDLILMCNLLLEISKATNLIVEENITHSTIFEDNKGCVELANAPRLCPRTNTLASNNTTSDNISSIELSKFSGVTPSISLLTFSTSLYLLLPLNILGTCYLVCDIASISVHTIPKIASIH